MYALIVAHATLIDAHATLIDAHATLIDAHGALIDAHATLIDASCYSDSRYIDSASLIDATPLLALIDARPTL